MATKHSNGDGTVYKRKDGRYEAALYLQAAGGSRKRVRAYGSTHAEARAKLVALATQAAAGVPVPDRNWRLGAYLDHWLETVVAPTCRLKTHELYAGVARLHLKPSLGREPLTGLGVARLQAFINEQHAAGRSARLIGIMRTVLSAALTQAQREELLVRNPARLLRLPTWRPKEVTPWTPEQANRFLAAAAGDPLHPAFVLLILYGLRRGEVLGLRWSDIDEAAGVLRVRQQIQRLAGRLQEVPVKTAAGQRDLPLLPLAEHALADRRAVAGEGGGGDLVFTTSTGQPVEPHNLARSFHRIRRAAGIEQTTLHHLRHTTATLLKNLKVPVRDAQLILGHASPVTTQQIYQHADVEVQRTALRGVEGLLTATVDSVRCRQLQPSKSIFDVLVTMFRSGGPSGTRTHDTLLKSFLSDTYADPLTGVLEVVRGAARARLVGRVAVSVAVSLGPRPQEAGQLARHWLGLLDPPTET